MVISLLQGFKKFPSLCKLSGPISGPAKRYNTYVPILKYNFTKTKKSHVALFQINVLKIVQFKNSGR